MNNNSNISSIIQSNVILVGICIFVVVFIIMNYDKIKSGDTSNISVGNTMLISMIILLLVYLLTLDEEEAYKEEELEIKKFKLNDISKEGLKGGSKYKIANNTYSNINDFDNTNIFISQKHMSRYGIKF